MLDACFLIYFQGDDGHSSTRSRGRTSGGSDDVYIGKYKLIKTIGKGNFAKVKLAKHLPTGREVRYINNIFLLVLKCVPVVWDVTRSVTAISCKALDVHSRPNMKLAWC